MGPIGTIHFIAAIGALITGTWILAASKGTGKHKLIGYFYSVFMMVVLVTAFMIYKLWGGWGIFHWAAVIGSVTLVAGMLPILTRRPRNNYISLHLSFMYWSVMGLYGAFAAETLVRVPRMVIDESGPLEIFYQLVGVATGLVMLVAAYFFIRYKPIWEKRMKQSMNKMNSAVKAKSA